MAETNKTGITDFKGSKTILRKMDFLEQRVFGLEHSDADARSRSLSGDFGAEGMDGITPAEYRMRLLAEYRNRELKMIEEGSMEDSSGLRSLRDVAIGGQRNWIPIGPAGVEKGQAYRGPVVSGRAKAIAVALDGKRVYLATANGGAWFSPDAGYSWVPLMNGLNYFDSPAVAPFTTGHSQNIGSLSCGAIALVPGTLQANDQLFIGTGEGDGMTDSYVGIGVLMSRNGGLTWETEPSDISLYGKGFYGFAFDPDQPENLVAGTSDGIFRREASGGGFEWKQKAFAGDKVSGVAFAKASDGTKKFFAAIWGGSVHSSADGINWNPLGNLFPASRVGRVAIAVKPDEPRVVYAQIALTGPPATGTASETDPASSHLMGIFRYDAGIDEDWRKIAGAPNNLFGSDFTKSGQGHYDNVIIVSPDNVNRIYAGGSTVNYAGGWVASLFRLEVKVTGNGLPMVLGTNETIGANVHPDVHGLAFTPGDPEKLWVACDGGLFFTDKARTGRGPVFRSCNSGLQTLTMNYLGVHPTEEEVLFCGAQDNGGLRYTGEDIWLHATPGDGGTFLVNWVNPRIGIINYHSNMLNRTVNGGNRPEGGDYDYRQYRVPVNVSSIAANHEQFLFYSPLAQVPQPAVIDTANPAHVIQANLLAFGTQRPWISTDFGLNWLPLISRLSGSDASFLSDIGNLTGALITAIAFLDSKRLVVGLNDGNVYRYTDNSPNNDWSAIVAGDVEHLTAATVTGAPFTINSITDIALRPGHPNEFFVCIGGIIGGGNPHRHVWHFDGAQWLPKEGTVPAKQLLNVHCNAIVATEPDRIFVGTDVGIWASSIEGADFAWNPFSFGLPETAVIDLQLSQRTLSDGQQLVLLRASTYGRGVFEYQISPALPPPAPGSSVDVQLYLRDHYLDKGRYGTRTGITDPRDYNSTISTTNSPDIKISKPDRNGAYQFPPGYSITPGEFCHNLHDDFNDVPVPSSGKIISKVYVQLHNRSAFSAERVSVMLLAHSVESADLPLLPDGYANDLRGFRHIDRDGWKTIGLKMAKGMYAAHPAIVEFDFSSGLLPAYNTINGDHGTDYVLVALIHHFHDPFASNNRIINPGSANNLLFSEEKKVSVKRIKLKRADAVSPQEAGKTPICGFTSIPATATGSGSPFDAMLADTFRSNDHLLHALMAAGLAAPFGSRGNMANPPAPDASDLVFADQLNISSEIILRPGIPLIWRARQKITLTAKINGKGKGPSPNTDGDFGGAGGGSATNSGSRCILPHTNPAMEIAAASVNTDGAAVDPVWASRAWLYLQHSKGGGAGGAEGATMGGRGGGIVVLCAPVIEFGAGGMIDVSGESGAANAGCGGGGLVLLIAGEITGLLTDGAGANVMIQGGQPTAPGTGKAGGNGLLIQKIIA